MKNFTYSHGDDQPPVRRFGKRTLRTILTLNDCDFEHYIRNGDDPDLYRLDDLEATVQAFAHHMGGADQPLCARTQAQTEPRGLDVIAR